MYLNYFHLCDQLVNVCICVYLTQNGQTAADIAEEMGYTEISALFQKRRSSQTISSTVRHILIFYIVYL